MGNNSLKLLYLWVAIAYTSGVKRRNEMSMRYAAWLLMSEEDYGDYIEECMCGRGDGCDCEGHEAKARADEEDGKREAAEARGE